MTAKEYVQEALDRGEQLLKMAKHNGRIMTELELHNCLSILYGKKNNTYDSMLHLHHALSLGEREGYLRIFTDTPELASLLRQYAEIRRNGYMPELQSGVTREYLKTVLSVANELLDETVQGLAEGATAHTLTSRETEVLQLIAEGLSNKEIAKRLVLTEGTVKIHLHRIYGKLQVKGRVQAIQKAKQYGLIQ